jgi:DnaK suppressor protein
MEISMSKTLVSTPDRPYPQLAKSLPRLRAALEEQRRFRLDQLAELDQQTAPIGPEVGSLDSAGRFHPTDPAAAERARREVIGALSVAARQALDDIETALDHMNAGRYGSCLGCGVQIPLERLQLLPQTTSCVGCQREAGSKG